MSSQHLFQDFLMLVMLFLPIAGAVGIAIGQGPRDERYSRAIALIVSIVTFFISIILIGGAHSLSDAGTFSALVEVPWVKSWGITFSIGMDGLSALMVLLTNLLVIISILASWSSVQSRTKEFFAFVLVLQTGINGTFLALDFFLFYVFWELMLVPLYFLIGIFGSGNRLYAAMKFFLYTMAGSVLMLIGILTLYFKAGALLPEGPTFALKDLLAASSHLPLATQKWIFLSFFLAFAIKVPLFPFHTWLPDAHTEAPTAGSILLAGVLLKTGVYGLLRWAIPLFPAAAQAYDTPIMILALISIVYGALAAFAQQDMKRLVAYSSVSHMGFIVLGAFSGNLQATAGSALQMFNHGISTAGLFFCVGVLYERRHTRLLSEYGGLAHRMTVYSILTIIVVLSSVGLPGLNGFVGEFAILIGTLQTHPTLGALATIGVILSAVYLLRMVQKTFYGPLENEKNKTLSDVNFRESFSLCLLVVIAFWVGLYAKPFFRLLEPTSAAVSVTLRPPEDPDAMQPVVTASAADAH